MICNVNNRKRRKNLSQPKLALKHFSKMAISHVMFIFLEKNYPLLGVEQTLCWYMFLNNGIILRETGVCCKSDLNIFLLFHCSYRSNCKIFRESTAKLNFYISKNKKFSGSSRELSKSKYVSLTNETFLLWENTGNLPK